MIWFVQPGKGYDLILLAGKTSGQALVGSGTTGQFHMTTASTTPAGTPISNFNNTTPGKWTANFTGDASVKVSTRTANSSSTQDITVEIYNENTTTATNIYTTSVTGGVTETQTGTITYSIVSGDVYYLRAGGSAASGLTVQADVDTYWQIKTI